MFANIHHHSPHQSGIWSIQNKDHDFDSANTLFNYSFGIHPWHINQKTYLQDIDSLKIASKKKHVLAIGECGIDRLCSTPLPIQKETFIHHIVWANMIAKPLIIHCVKAHQEILQILKEYPCHVPVIFHGYNNNETIAKQILKAGYYLSFGKSLFKPSMELIFNKLPLEHIFLETDNEDCSIQSIYSQACMIRNISLNQLCRQIQKNIQRVFNLTI